MEEMAKLDKLRILKELESEDDPIVLKVEELKPRWRQIEDWLSEIITRYLENKKESDILHIAK